MIQFIRKRLPSRLALAWAILGASACITLMYSKFVFDCEDQVYFDIGEINGWGPHDLKGQLNVFDIVVFAGNERGNEAKRIVAQWRLAVVALLGLIGASIGLTVNWVRRRPSVPGGHIDLILWLSFSAIVFTILARFGIPGEYSVLWRYADSISKILNNFTLVGGEAIRLALLALLIGWAARTVAGGFGLRWPPGTALDQAADYDDRQ